MNWLDLLIVNIMDVESVTARKKERVKARERERERKRKESERDSKERGGQER